MAIHNIGLSFFGSDRDEAKKHGAYDYADFTKRLMMHQGDSDSPVYLKWRTASGADVNESFDIAVNYRVVPKVATEGGGMSAWATDWSTWAKEVPSSSCNPQQTDGDGGWQWSLNFASLLGTIEMGNANIMDILAKNGSFSFGNRYYDRIEFGIRIKSHYVKDDDGGINSPGETIGAPGTATTSPRTDATFIIDYVPNYIVQDVYCDTLDTVKVKYICEDWKRSDDRFCIEAFSVGGKSIIASKPWGTITRTFDAENEVAIGTAAFPVTALTDLPLDEGVELEIRFNPSYGASGEEFARASYSGDFKGGGSANIPVFFVSPNINGILEIKPQDFGGDIKPITHCFVKMCGSDKPFDQTIVPVNDWSALPYVPRGVPVAFKAIGVAEDGCLSDVVTISAEIDPIGWLTLVSLDDPSMMATASYDIDIKRTKQRDSETVKLAGRPRPCTYYGDGGEATIDASFSIPHECMVEHPSETEDAWWDIAMAGDCVMLTADGKRTVVSVDDVSASEPVDDNPVTMSVSLSEVDA